MTIQEQIKVGFAQVIEFLKNGGPNSGAASSPTGEQTKGASVETPAAGAITAEILAEIKAQLEPVANELNQAKADLGTARRSIESVTAENAELKKQLEAKDKELAAEKEKTTNFEAKVKESGNQQAIELLANLNVKPVKIEGSGDATTQGSIIEQYNAIKDPQARAQFYVKNKAKFFAEARKAS